MAFAEHRLEGKTVAVLAADGFEYVELSVPRKALLGAGATLEIVSLHSGKVRGMNLTEPTRAIAVDRTLADADPDAYDALLIPGGFVSPDLLRQSRLARDFVQAFDVANKPIATLCHGPWLLVSAELVAGRRLAAWPGLRDDIVHADGTWRDEPLVRDGNWVTSRGPQDLAQFVPAMIELFAKGARTGVAHDGESAHMQSSPKPDAPYEVVVTAARLLPGPTLRTLATVAAATAIGALAVRRAH
jgi:protease I